MIESQLQFWVTPAPTADAAAVAENRCSLCSDMAVAAASPPFESKSLPSLGSLSERDSERTMRNGDDDNGTADADRPDRRISATPFETCQ